MRNNRNNLSSYTFFLQFVDKTLVLVQNVSTVQYGIINKGKGNGKVIPLRARCGPDGGQSYISTLP